MEICDNKSNENSIKGKFFEAISNGEINIVKEIFKNENKIPFWLYKEAEGSTALIKSVFLNMTDISVLLIDEAKKNLASENIKEFMDYVNKKGDNGFNALHYAAFRGNIRILEKLIQSGADINIKNNSGLNVMHMAAQGDQPNVLVFFKEKYDMQVSTLDSVLSTPLHWACYMGAESSVDYLTSWNSDINARDKDGFTPLHLAVMTGKIFYYSNFRKNQSNKKTNQIRSKLKF
jgi:ankyrin repeat protein